MIGAAEQLAGVESTIPGAGAEPVASGSSEPSLFEQVLSSDRPVSMFEPPEQLGYVSELAASSLPAPAGSEGGFVADAPVSVVVSGVDETSETVEVNR